MDEIPARGEEVHHAIEEGVEFMCLHNPIEYSGDENGRVKSMKLQVMELGEPDDSGRRRPMPIEGKFEELPVDLVIVSVGVSPNPLIPSCLPSVRTSKWGTVLVGDETMQSDVEEVFAGGDIVRGGATVILAMGDGRKAADSMDAYFKK
jgi:glutamate synthase (NADPH/NADH) small chain